MTTLSTVFGMLPLAFSQADGSEYRSPMGILAIGGMLSSTALTLLVVPVVYSLLDDAVNSTNRLIGVARRHGLRLREFSSTRISHE